MAPRSNRDRPCFRVRADGYLGLHEACGTPIAPEYNLTKSGGWHDNEGATRTFNGGQCCTTYSKQLKTRVDAYCKGLPDSDEDSKECSYALSKENTYWRDLLVSCRTR